MTDLPNRAAIIAAYRAELLAWAAEPGAPAYLNHPPAVDRFIAGLFRDVELYPRYNPLRTQQRLRRACRRLGIRHIDDLRAALEKEAAP